MAAENNICEGCPAAFALGFYTGELASQDSTFRIEARRNEAKKARCVLENAAGQIACKTIDKQLPELPESASPTGSNGLIEFVSQCPSFSKYLELRATELE